MTHASRNTTTGLLFEEKARLQVNGTDVTKHKLYQYLSNKGIDYKTILSKKLLPDEAYIDEVNSCLRVYEKKFQQTAGSADEKPQTCAFKIFQYKKIAAALGLKNTTYTYIFNDWFKKPEYADMLNYIKSVEGCDYFFWED
jgi:CRISPR/Cas system CMR-associated protein Cmr1 (group 7 of RAMP superfamily)